MRRKNYIKQINHKDIRFLNALRCCNHLSPEQAQSLISPQRIKNYIKQGVIEPIYAMRKSKTIPAYAITAQGRRWASRNVAELQGQSWYQAATAVPHNIKLAEQYLQITQAHPDCQILTEYDLREYLHRQLENREDRYLLLEDLQEGRLSVPDMAYVEGKEIICIEITTSTYGTAEIAAKAAFGEVTGATVNFIRS